MSFNTKPKDLIADVQGNIAITFAIALLPIVMTIGAAVDYSQSFLIKSRIASATDAALLAAAVDVRESVDLTNKDAAEEALKRKFEPFFLANMPVSHRSKYRGFSLTYDPASGQINVDVRYDFRTSILGIAGIDKLDVGTNAATAIKQSIGGAVSMYLVLDKSGSMNSSANGRRRGTSRMSALKTAVATMISQYQNKDPDHKYVRMGVVSYDSYSQSPYHLAWGTSGVNTYVQRLRARGGTNSSQAVYRAYRGLNNRIEEREHQRKSQQSPTKVMIFMTDGSNNANSYDRTTIRNCNRAKRADIEIYTVAFRAPWRGQQLLKNCASDNSHYFNATNTADLVAAFSKIGSAINDKLVLTK